MATAERLTDSVAYHGEGIVWHPGWGGLRWVDMLAGDILSLDRVSGVVGRVHVDSSVAAAVRPRRDGGFVVATERGFALWTEEGREWSSPELWSSAVRFNEGSCDPAGRFLCGTMSYDRTEGAGSLWRLGPETEIERVLDGVTISNGLGFTADGATAYYVDSRTRRIDRFDVVDSELRDRRPFVSLPEGVGNPDGLCVDAEGGVWVALYNGAAVRRYDASGSLDGIVELPVSRVTSCTLGGDDLSTLYITTSRENLEPGEEPEAGSLFTAEVGVRGIPVLTAAL